MHGSRATEHTSGWTLCSAGGCEGVTGSAHLLATAGRRVLVDAGMFQGADERANTSPWPFEPRSIDAVVLTHGHLDHVGRLPTLVAGGFRGPVYATEATIAVADVILRDAARIQAEDADRARKRLRRAGRRYEHVRALFDDAAVDQTLERMTAVPFGERVDLGRGVGLRLGRAGHVLGAAWVELVGPTGSVLVSGDLGDDDGPLHPPPEAPPQVDALLIETTYADRRHRAFAATRAEFGDVVGRTLARGGNVLIPTFALERTQSVLHTLQELERSGEIPVARVVLDAPMGARMTELYRRHHATLRHALAARLVAGDDPFTTEGFSLSRTAAESRTLNDARGVVILAGAGMMSGGRILHHLKHHLWDARSALVVVGYQAEGTLGRRIVDGAKRVRVMGHTVAVAAEVHTINGFSSHADAPALDAFRVASGASLVVPVHGERRARQAFAERARADGVTVVEARLGRTVALSVA
jgi:metallo-beta-lactamase family protein